MWAARAEEWAALNCEFDVMDLLRGCGSEAVTKSLAESAS